MRIVVDTNVLLSALRSAHGASFVLLQLLGRDLFSVHVSVPLVLEYEAVVKRHLSDLPVNADDVEDVLDFFCSVAELHAIFYGWRPQLRDPDDDMVLEVAVAASADIVTFNKRDFVGCEQFGVRLWTPAEFLRKIGVLQ